MLLEREPELELLERLADEACSGRGRVVVIEGPAGIGKTSLLEVVRSRARERGMTALHARASELDREFPFGVVRQLFERVLARADPERRDALTGVLFDETSTLGVRLVPVERLRVEREVREVETPFGRVRVKIGKDPGGHVNVAPEYDDCKRLAVAAGVALKRVYQEATAAALAGEKGSA